MLCQVCGIHNKEQSCIHIERQRIMRPNPESKHVMHLRKRHSVTVPKHPTNTMESTYCCEPPTKYISFNDEMEPVSINTAIDIELESFSSRSLSVDNWQSLSQTPEFDDVTRLVSERCNVLHGQQCEHNGQLTAEDEFPLVSIKRIIKADVDKTSHSNFAQQQVRPWHPQKSETLSSTFGNLCKNDSCDHLKEILIHTSDGKQIQLQLEENLTIMLMPKKPITCKSEFQCNRDHVNTILSECSDSIINLFGDEQSIEQNDCQIVLPSIGSQRKDKDKMFLQTLAKSHLEENGSRQPDSLFHPVAAVLCSDMKTTESSGTLKVIHSDFGHWSQSEDGGSYSDPVQSVVCDEKKELLNRIMKKSTKQSMDFVSKFKKKPLLAGARLRLHSGKCECFDRQN